MDGNLCTVTSEGSLQQVVYDAEKVVLEKKKKKVKDFVSRKKVLCGSVPTEMRFMSAIL